MKIDIVPDLKVIVRNTFKCVVCLRAPLRPPAAFQRCCKSIVGCLRCVDELYSTITTPAAPCPKCRHDRGCSQMTPVLGLDELLAGLSYLEELDRANESDSDDDSLPEVMI